MWLLVALFVRVLMFLFPHGLVSAQRVARGERGGRDDDPWAGKAPMLQLPLLGWISVADWIPAWLWPQAENPATAWTVYLPPSSDPRDD